MGDLGETWVSVAPGSMLFYPTLYYESKELVQTDSTDTQEDGSLVKERRCSGK